jgi:hypothetical protein
LDDGSGHDVKIHLDMTGKPLAKPDFAMLRAGLTAAAATTPTAAASDKAHARLDLTEALIRLFGDDAADAKGAVALHGSFNPASVREEGETEK